MTAAARPSMADSTGKPAESGAAAYYRAAERGGREPSLPPIEFPTEWWGAG